MIPRLLTERFSIKLKSSRFLLVQGPRNCGKGTFISQAASGCGEKLYFIDCRSLHEDLDDRLQNVPADHGIVVLDEAQYIKDFNALIDSILRGKYKQTIIASCSFRPMLEDEFIEALRMEEMLFTVFAPTFYETASFYGLPEEEKLLTERLIYGNYPSVLANLAFAEMKLKGLIDDVLETHPGPNDRMNKGEKLLKMMQLLAFGIGEPLSYNDLGERCGLDNETVERYIDLLEEAFILIRLSSYHTDQRYELKKSHCFYFYDNGIRNVLINNFNPADLRMDMQVLWQNYLIAERIKWVRMNGASPSFYFWRTHTSQQVDLIESDGAKIAAYKMDWEKRGKIRVPKWFTALYPEVKVSVIQRNSYWNFLNRKVK